MIKNMKIFLSGYYGAKNLGDELLLFKIIEDITKLIPQVEFSVWSLDKDFTDDFLKDFPITAVDRFNPTETVNAVKNSDIVVLGGGGIIQEYDEIKIEDLFRYFGYNIPSYAIPPLLGKIFNKKVFYWCLGHGPVVTEDGLLFSRWFYSLADVVAFRDEHSYCSAKKFLPEAKIYLDTDPLLDFDFKRFSIEKKEENILGVSIRKWFNEDELISKTVEALKKIMGANNHFKILPIPCDFNLDIDVLKKLISQLPEENLISFSFENIWDTVRAISLCDWFLGMRLHSLISAYKLEKPALGISYDAKTEIFLKSVDSDYVKATELTSEELFLKLKKLVKSRSLKQKKFEYKTPEIFKSFISESEISLTYSDPVSEEQSYVQDFVKTLMLQRESLYTKVNTLQMQNDMYFNKLNEIYTSNFWKVAKFYYRVRDRFLLRSIRNFLKWLKRSVKSSPYPEYFSKFRSYAKRYGIRQALRRSCEKLMSDRRSFPHTYVKIELDEILRCRKGDRDIVIYPPTIDWNHTLFQRPHHIMLGLARRGFTVIFCTPNQIDSLNSNFVSLEENLYLCKNIDALLKLSGRKDLILYISNTMHKSLIEKLRPAKVIYDYIDELEVFSNYDSEMVIAHKELLRNADLVLVTAERLYRAIQHIRKDAVLCPNAADYWHFANAQLTGPRPLDFEQRGLTSRPIIGYYGALAEWVDYDLLAKAARQRPNYDFVLIGLDYDGSVHKSGIMSIPNVHYLGPKQ